MTKEGVSSVSWAEPLSASVLREKCRKNGETFTRPQADYSSNWHRRYASAPTYARIALRLSHCRLINASSLCHLGSSVKDAC